MEANGFHQLSGYNILQNIFFFSSTEERNSHRFGKTTWAPVNDDKHFWV